MRGVGSGVERECSKKKKEKEKKKKGAIEKISMPSMAMSMALSPSFFKSLSLSISLAHLHKQTAHVDSDRHVVHQLLEHLPLRGPAVGRRATRRRERSESGAELGDLAAGLGGALGAVLLVVGSSSMMGAASGRGRKGATVSHRRHRGGEHDGKGVVESEKKWK